MAQSMLMSTSVSGGRALPSVQPAPYSRLALPSVHRHSNRSVSVKTLAIFGKPKAAKSAPAKKVRGYTRISTLLLLIIRWHACTLLFYFVPVFCAWG